ncbi:CD209 antigen-like protein 2 isoform X2 [Parambassis ranga]|uniref:CD209 antigen-like protein 2 isoform X2 n=1 Tax=Parambassis ranga TaxID=210632 RepID=A0A6P7I8E9_9TELE|nr:CD209 antigen-like protein 2 isoform X2 [Parambassis ranga]
MKMIFYVEDPENSAVYENVSTARSNPASKKHQGEQRTAAPASTGVKVYKVISVIVGIICILLVVYIVVQHLGLNDNGSTRDTLKNLTEERDDLKRTLLVVEAANKKLTGQRDELIQKMNDFDSQRRSLTEERDSMKALLMNLKVELGWVLFKCSTYYVSSEKKTWQASRDDCRQRGADLIIINSEEEQSFANQFKVYMWIGLTDLQTEGTWRWVDGTPLSTSYWGTNEPNGARGENCGDIKSFNAKNSWNDEKCANSLNWICEKKVCQ